MHRTTRLNVTDINQHFMCVICDGYIIDATTIVECLHSFCRTCIVRFLESSKFCPVCDVQVHKTKPLQSIRSDTTLQDVIYKLIPGLYQSEMHRRREFYADHPEAASKCSTEERGEGAEQRCFYSPKENISLTLEYFKGSESQVESESTSETPDKDVMTRHLNCPAAMTVAHLKKFVRMKFSLPLTYTIKILYAEHLLSDDYTLMDIAYIYSWRRAGPMKFLYTFAHRKHVAQRQTIPAIQEEPTTVEHPKQEEESAAVGDESVVTSLDDPIAPLPTSSDEPERMETEETNQPCATVACEPMQTSDTPSSTSTTDTPRMEVAETEIPIQNATTPSPSEAPSPSMVEHLSSAVVPAVSSGIKLKLIHCPAEPKAAKSRKSTGARKGGRTRYKSAPVPQRFPRLAPYPPPHQTAACLAMRKYNVPAVMTSIAPNLMLSFVPTTANSLCSMNSNNSKPTILPTTSLCSMNSNNSSKPTILPTTSLCSMNTSNSNLPAILPTTSLCSMNTSSNSSKPAILPTTSNSNLPSIPPTSLCSMNTSNSNQSAILPAAVLPTMINGQNKAPVCVGQDKKSTSSEITESQAQPNGIVATEALAPRPAFYPPPQQQQQTAATKCSAPSPLGHLAMANTQTPFGVPSSLMAALVCTTIGNSSATSSSPVSKMADMVNRSSEKKVPGPSMPSILQTALCEDKTGKKSQPQTASVAPPPETAKVQCNGGTVPPSSNKDAASFQFSPDKKSAFELSVKNSISAEFSDNDDLGCQPDLVVDERKMEEDDEEEEDDALRKKIAAIAEDDGQDEDSGRASDISSQARCSSCDDDSVPATTSITCLPSFSLATSSSAATPNRTSKSNNINHVINNLLLRNHERKDSMGALDLSTCTKTTPGGGPSRPKPVANPVLDIKHRQQAYLPAPNSNNTNNNSKQHTACVPSPKHPILMHGLTTPLQLSAMQGKSPHLPVPPFHGTAMVYTSQNRTISSPTYSTSPSAHQAILSGSFPRMTSMSSYQIRNVTPTTSAMRNSYGPMKGISISPNHSLKGLSSSPNSSAKGIHLMSPSSNSATKSNHLTSPSSNLTSKGNHLTSPSSNSASKSNHLMSPTHNSNHHAKGTNSNNKGMSPSPNAPRTFSPAANHIKGLASPPQNPYSKGSNKSVPSYKKSTTNFPVYGGGKKPPANPSYKSYNTKFKSTGNLAVINPDPNGSLHKLVIRNLDARPTSPQKL